MPSERKRQMRQIVCVYLRLVGTFKAMGESAAGKLYE